MQRLAGFILIAVGSGGLGLWYSVQFVQRVRHIRQMCRILELLMSQIRYVRAELPECCLCLAGQTEPPYSEAFREIYDRMRENAGADFRQICREVLQPCLDTLPVKPEEKELFLAGVSGHGGADGQMQLRSVESCLEELRTKAESLERETGEKSRMAVGMGVMGGLLLIIILL